MHSAESVRETTPQARRASSSGDLPPLSGASPAAAAQNSAATSGYQPAAARQAHGGFRPHDAASPEADAAAIADRIEAAEQAASRHGGPPLASGEPQLQQQRGGDSSQRARRPPLPWQGANGGVGFAVSASGAAHSPPPLPLPPPQQHHQQQQQPSLSEAWQHSHQQHPHEQQQHPQQLRPIIERPLTGAEHRAMQRYVQHADIEELQVMQDQVELGDSLSVTFTAGTSCTAV